MKDTIIHKLFRLPYNLHVDIDNKSSKSDKTIVFIHGLGSSTKMWQEVTTDISHARIITVDLLGFGQSPKPDWGKFDLKSHARALHRTLLKLHCNDNIILVGHSLGSLVAVEYASRYQHQIVRLILSSPPLYQPAKNNFLSEKIYRKMYAFMRRKPVTILKSSKLMRANKGIKIDNKILPAYIKSLESSIENQNTLKRIHKIKSPIDIIYGRFDVLLITKNLKNIAKNNPNIKLHPVAAGHEISGLYQTKLLSIINKSLHIEN